MNFMNIIGIYKDVLEIVFSGVLAFFTIALAIFTLQLYRETKKTRIKDSTPQISLYFFIIIKDIIGLKIKNTSLVDAKNINIMCLNNNTHEDGSNTYIYSEKLSRSFHYLASNQEYAFVIGRYNVVKKESFDFKISFTDMKGKIKVKNDINIDMNALQKMIIDRDPNKEIADILEKIYTVFSTNRTS